MFINRSDQTGSVKRVTVALVLSNLYSVGQWACFLGRTALKQHNYLDAFCCEN